MVTVAPSQRFGGILGKGNFPQIKRARPTNAIPGHDDGKVRKGGWELGNFPVLTLSAAPDEG